MAISVRNRKLLWGRSGNRCAKCRRELIMADTPGDDKSIIGDECHIVSAVPVGPRYDPNFSREMVDHYRNLILLCKVDHKLIDDQEQEYTACRLSNLKASHEKWVSEQLDSSGSNMRRMRIRRVPENAPAYLQRIRLGKELMAIVSNACAYAPHYDDLERETEDELVASFLQDAQDWGDLGLESVSDRVCTSRSLDGQIRALERAGFWIFGAREQQILEAGTSSATEWSVAHIQVLRNTNPEIIVLGEENGDGKHSADSERAEPRSLPTSVGSSSSRIGRRAVIDDLDGLEEKIDRAQEVATEERIRSAGGLSIGPIALGVVGVPGTIGRDGARWLVGDGYVVMVTNEQAGHTFNISRSDSWPPARIGPWDDHRRLMNLAHLLKSGHVAVSHIDHDDVRHYRFRF